MQVRARLARSIGAALAVAALATSPALAADQTVTIEGFAYSPGVVTVTVGDTVTWTNRDGASHTATADDGSFDTGGISGNASDSIEFTTAGEFRYHCTIHPDMTARVVVQAAGGTGATPPATDVDRPAAADADSTGPANPILPTVAFALLAIAGLSGALGWRLRTARVR
ncbi:MAG TPA: plastocyanin/azurin family copper-binding protein [Candidatus Limnocylindrales bacterium]|nr:plastocyanin/azurin family copper-binding protein [Candidatus Limnocylindrales bacterium]